VVGPTLPDNWASIKAGRRNTTRQEMTSFIVQSGECRQEDTIYFSMIIEHVILILEKAASYKAIPYRSGFPPEP
jgi:hypothetical protein